MQYLNTFSEFLLLLANSDLFIVFLGTYDKYINK